MNRARAIRWGLAGLLLGLLGSRWLALNAADRWWAGALGAAAGHGRIDTLRFTLFLWAFLAAAVWFVGNLSIVHRAVGSVHVPRRLANLQINEAVPRSVVRRWLVAVGLLVAFAVSYRAGAWWKERALAGAAAPTGIVDPILGNDVSYYLLSLPWARTVHGFATILSLVGLGLVTMLYVATGAVAVRDRRLAVAEAARRHLAGLLAALAVLLVWGYRLEAPELVAGLHGVPYDTVLVDVRIPTSRLLSALGALAFVTSLLWFRYARFGIVVFGWTALAGFSVLGHFVIPSVAAGSRSDEEMVPPVVSTAQRMLRQVAYGLVDRDTTLAPSHAPDPAAVQREIRQAPVWDEFVVAEALSPSSPRVAYASIGRYPGNEGAAVPVFLGVRDAGAAAPDGPGARPRAGATGSHGAPELVAIRGDSTGADGAPLYLADLERPGVVTEAGSGVRLDGDVLFTPFTRGHRVVRDPPEGEDGPAGVLVGGLARRVALAWRLQSPALLSAASAPSGARVVWHPGVVDRLERFAPFARFELPMPVVLDGRLSWLSWGYVSSAGFPLSRPVRWREETVRYLRAGLLGVVDAVTGRTRVYRAENADPVTLAWERLAPDIVLPPESLPPGLHPHLRYPVELFAVQVGLLREPEGSGRPPLGFFGRASAGVRPPPEDELSWWLGTAPGDTVRRLRLRTTVARGDPPLLAGIAEGVVLDWRPSFQLFRLLPPLTVPAPSQLAERFASDAGELVTGAIRTVPVGDGLVSIQSAYDVPDEEARPTRLARVFVGVGTAVGRGTTVTSAAEEALATSRLPSDAMPEWTSAQRWFRRLDEARRAADWRAFGEAYEALRRLFLASPDSAGR